MKINKGATKNFKVRSNSNLLVTVIAGIVALCIAAGIFFALKTALATENYYVLNQDVPGKTLITDKMLQEIVTSKGSAPQNAITLAQVKQGTVYSKYPLKAGDVLSASNTGLNLDTGVGIPDDWVITAFNINSDDAAGGNISKGDYFDIIGVDKENGAKYLFFNVLALEVNQATKNTTVNSEGKIIPLGEQLQYVIGMPAKDAALLQHSIAKYKGIKLVLSPESLKYKSREIQDLQKVFIESNDLPAPDLYKGTDNTFAPVLRDDKGVPVNSKNCVKGIISPKSLCSKVKIDKADLSPDDTSSADDTNSKPESKPSKADSQPNGDKNSDSKGEVNEKKDNK